MKIYWPAIWLFWLPAAFIVGFVVYAFWWHRVPVEQVKTPPAPTVTVQPPAAVPPIPSPKPRYRPVTSAKRSAVHAPAYKKPVYAPAYKKVTVDCKQVPQIAKSMPWPQVQSAAEQRGLSYAQIAELKACMAR